MFNSSPFNSFPLNGLPMAQQPPADPVVVPPPLPPNPPLPPVPQPPEQGIYAGFPVPPPPAGHSFRWSAIITMGGVDVSERLTGRLRADREESGAGIAEFGLFYMPGDTVQTDLADRTVTIDYVTDDGQDAVQVRLFTGLVDESSWDAPARTMRVIATDNLQNSIEALTVTQVDALTQGAWTDDVYSPAEDRSRWDYAQERMRSRAASLNCNPLGDIVTSSWYAKPQPDYIFGYNTTIHESIAVDLAQMRSVTNRVEISVTYRYPRLHDKRETYTWVHPDTDNIGGLGGFCEWRKLTSELPDKRMVISATSGAGLIPISANWYELPPTNPDPCGTGQPWINNQDGLLLGAGWTGARRWNQAVTETYRLNLATAAGQVEGQQAISRLSTSIGVEDNDEDGWSSSLNPITEGQQGSSPIGPSNPSYGAPGDRPHDDRRIAAIGCMLQVAQTEIIAAHRRTTVSWSVPTSMALGVDLAHTIELDDQYTKARAKCSRRVDELDFETGSAITTISLSVMRGGGVSDPLLVPERLGINDLNSGGGGGIAPQVMLATQLGGRFISPTYNDELDGFAGNYTSKQDFTLETFPRRLAITAPEIPAEQVDEKLHELELAYRVGIPDDLLEL